MPEKAIVIGAGFAGLAAACELASAGMEVTVLEKNDQIGGRARYFQAEGFTFDMGPSWYWMPRVFETFFNRYNSKVSDHYDLVRLDPGFQCIMSQEEVISVPSDPEQIYRLFESIETGCVRRTEKVHGGDAKESTTWLWTVSSLNLRTVFSSL